ncbi:MAG: transcriptional regulator [Robiginitomaculum sp.]|nr:MAG: transcriptional regulator [Robiginitomaculum sp.]
MAYIFDNFELDTTRIELRKDGIAQAVEPQVFDLLVLLVENTDRLVTRDEIVEKIWQGRNISVSVLASRIKSARRVLGDDGRTQRFIKTIHGRGFRFIEPVRKSLSVVHNLEPKDTPASEIIMDQAVSTRPSIAVLPLNFIGSAISAGHDSLSENFSILTLADAFPHEMITELSRLRWLMVISRGSSFSFRGEHIDVREVGKALGVGYCLSGSIEIIGAKIGITLELADTSNGGIVWADRYESHIDGIHEMRAQIISNIISTLEVQITTNEANRARLIVPGSLDAWSTYHLGLQHMHRYNEKDNAIATDFFTKAVAIDPGFARAHAGLSFTYFQNVFFEYKCDPMLDAVRTRYHAEQSLACDGLDPFANFTMGRSFWLLGEREQSLEWFEHATDLCPNYAQGYFSRAFVEAINGRASSGQTHADTAIMLSPRDPYLYGALGARALSHITRGHDSQAALWAEKAAVSPGAHALFAMIAVAAHDINGDQNMAKKWTANVRSRYASLKQYDFFQAFPFKDKAVKNRMAKALEKYGF